MLKQIFNNRKLILEGIRNNIFKKEHVEEIAYARLNLCKKLDVKLMNEHIPLII
jgi:hypothetical protein